MSNKKLVLSLSGMVVLMLNTGTTRAETAGYVQFVNGEAMLTPANGAPHTLQKGEPIGEGDTISTVQKAAVQIRMQDGGLIALREDTQLKFDSFRFSGKKGQPEKSYFSLIMGGVRAVTGVIAHVNKQEYEISTPAATIDMRGADHETIYLPANVPGAQAGTYTKVNIGEATLKTNSGTVSVLPNRMGFAGGLDQTPRIRPIDIGIFTVAVAPREAEVNKESKADNQEQGGVQNPQDAAGDKKPIVASKQEQQPAAKARSENLPGSTELIRNSSVVDYTRLAPNINTNAFATLDIPENIINTTAIAPAPQTVFPIAASYTTMFAGIQPVDSAGIGGKLNNSTLSTDLTNQLVNAAFNLTMPGGLMAGTYAVTGTNGIGGIVNCTGTCAASASGYSVSFLITAAGLSYNIWPTTATGSPVADLVQGSVAYTATATPPPVTPPPVIPPPVIPPPVVITYAAYNPNHVAVESTAGFGTGNGGMATASGLTYVTGTKVGAGNLSTSGTPVSMTLTNAGVTATSTITPNVILISGGAGVTLPVYTATGATSANASAGIQYGSWRGYTGQTNTLTMQLGTQNGTVPSSWMYGPQGYLDAAYLPVAPSTSLSGAMAGTFTYQMDGATAPHSLNSGLNGTLTSASITADFINMLVSANLALTMPGNENWGATLTSQPLTVSVFNSVATPGVAGTLAVTRSVGAAIPLAPCATCGGSLGGAFTGQNYAGAILSYSLYNNAQSVSDVSGNVALTRNYAGNLNPAVNNNLATTPTTSTVLALGGGVVQPGVSMSGTAISFPLTSYVTPIGPANIAVTCPTCTATPSGQVASSGIYYGNWTSGTLKQTAASTFAAGSMPPSYWITGPEAGPVYLPQALTGTASYVFNAGQVSNGKGNPGTVLGTTALTMDFNKQTVGINLDVNIVDSLNVSSHAWNARTLLGNEAVLGRGQVLGGASFQASTTNTGRAGLLTLSVDIGATAVTNPSATINGQLTGIGLTGAIISFNLGGTLNAATTAESINGVVAFSSPAANTATSYRYVSMAFYDPFAAVPKPALGLYANSATRVTQDSTGNLTQFDTQIINSIGAGSKTYANSTGTLMDYGSDPVSGISWGRWSGGTINVTDRTTGVVTPVTQAGSLHWITEPVATSATTLPTTGTYTYILAGGTSPTDNLGNVGTLNSATLAANFTAQTVNLGVSTTVAGATMNATGTNVPIIQQTAFYASSQEPATSASYLTVACSGTCGANPGGTVVGKFTGTGAIGATMSYGLQNGSSVVSGVAAFHR